jgi:sialate O-acetylesterase
LTRAGFLGALFAMIQPTTSIGFWSRQGGAKTSLLTFWSSRRGLTVLALLSLALNGHADVKLHGLFSDHMVLQQGQPAPVWGWADDGETVTVEFRGKKVSTIAKNGRWLVRLASLKAGGPDTMRVTGNNTLELHDVLVGEVWICSGQSNMEWPLSRSFESQNDIENAANPMIRLFTVPKLKAKAPVNDVKASWLECTPQSVPGFSAVGYYFGRALQQARKVPVGLIHTSWGGSPAEVWMSEKVLSANPEFQRDILDTFPAAWRNNQRQLENYQKEKAELEQQGKKMERRAPGSIWRPTEL